MNTTACAVLKCDFSYMKPHVRLLGSLLVCHNFLTLPTFPIGAVDFRCFFLCVNWPAFLHYQNVLLVK